MGVAAVLDTDHAAGYAIEHHLYRNVREGDGHHLVDRVRLTAAQIVGQVANHDFAAGSLADFLAKRLTNIDLLAMPIRIGLAVLADGAFLPGRSFGNHHQSIVAEVVLFIFGENFRHMIVLGTTNGWLTNVLTAVAVSRVDSAVVAMLQASVPLMVAVLAHFFFVEEPFRPRQFIGIMTGLTGILLIVGPIGVFGGRGSLLGITAMLLSALCYACGTIYGRHIASANPAALACGQQACGAAVAVLISLLFEPAGEWNQPISVWLLLAIVGSCN